MKRKNLITLLVLICVLACALSLAACSDRSGGGDQTPAEYTVVYDANGGKFENGDDVTIDDGSVISSDGTKMTLTTKLTTLMPPLHSPERERYAFCGWAKDKDGAVLWDFESDTLTGNTTLYAVWAVTFDYALSEDNSYYIVRGMGGLSGDVEIPETHNGKPVKEIAAEAFKNSRSLTGIVIADSVTEIGTRAFMNATKLESVKVGEGITRLPDQAFSGCDELAELHLPKALKEINYTAFGNGGQDALVEVHYAGTADEWCGIDMDCSTDNKANPLANGKAELYVDGEIATDITLNTEKVGRWAFYNYAALKSVHIGSGVKEIEREAFCYSGVSTLTFVEDAKITSIGQSAFASSQITSLEFPDSLTALGASAFKSSSKLESVKLGGVKYVGASAFEQCYALKTIDLGNAEELGQYAFASCEDALTSVTIPASVWYMDSPFSFCEKLSSVTFAQSADWYVTNMGNTETVTADKLTDANKAAERLSKGSEWMRSYGNGTYQLNANETEAILTGVTDKLQNTGVFVVEKNYMGKPVTSIAAGAFGNCGKLKSISIPDSVTEIGDHAFDGCDSLTNITVDPNNKNYVGYSGVLYNKSESGLSVEYIPPAVQSIILPDGIIMATYAFSHCTGLKSVVIPGSVEHIGYGAFKDCSNLTSVTIEYGVKVVDYYAFWNCSSLTSIEIPDSVTFIGESAFLGCSSLTSITLPFVGTSADIDEYRVLGCIFGSIFGKEQYDGSTLNDRYYIPSALKSVTVTGGRIYRSAFKGYSSLTSITLGNSVASIGNDAFCGCSGLTSIVISDSVTSIGFHAFLNCRNLTSVIIGKNVTDIGSEAFRACSSLKSIIIPNGVTSIGARAFSETAWYSDQPNGLVYAGKVAYEYKGTMPENTTITLLDGTKCIADSAFYGCRGLTSIVIPNSVTSIGASAFSGCRGLMSIVIPDSVTRIEEATFWDCGFTSITIPNSVTYIGSNNFGDDLQYNEYDNAYYLGNADNPYVALIKAKNTDITSCIIHENTKFIYFDAFSGCDNLQYNEYDNAYYLGNADNPYIVLIRAKNTDITSCIIHENTKFIDRFAFNKCSKLTSITIPDGVTSIGYYAFGNCSDLTSITIPNSVVSIESDVFEFCAIITIYCEAESQPSGWSDNWNYSDRPVVWDYKNK